MLCIIDNYLGLTSKILAHFYCNNELKFKEFLIRKTKKNSRYYFKKETTNYYFTGAPYKS